MVVEVSIKWFQSEYNEYVRPLSEQKLHDSSKFFSERNSKKSKKNQIFKCIFSMVLFVKCR